MKYLCSSVSSAPSVFPLYPWKSTLAPQAPKIFLNSLGNAPRVGILKLRSTEPGLLLRDHQERTFAQHAWHPRWAQNSKVVVIDAEVTKPHAPDHARLHRARERFRPRVEIVRSRPVALERIHPVRERVEVHGHERMGIGPARDDRS